MNISTKQRTILKILKAGGIIVTIERAKRNKKLLDGKRNAVKYVHLRTFQALQRKELIKKISNEAYGFIGADENISTETKKVFTQLSFL